MPTDSRHWSHNPLEYLVRVRFPLEQGYKAVVPDLGMRQPMVRDDAYLEQASDYRTELQQLPGAELWERARVAAGEQITEILTRSSEREARRFFHQPNANTDVEHWARMPLWTIDEMVALSLGKDPRSVNWENIRSEVQNSRFASKYQARRDIILRANQAGELRESTNPVLFIAWAARMNVDLPLPLVDGVKEIGVKVDDWKSAYEEQRRLVEEAKLELLAERQSGIRPIADYTAYIKKVESDHSEIVDAYRIRIDALEDAARHDGNYAPRSSGTITAIPEKQIGARERESLLKLVIGMAVGAYSYNPNASRSAVVSEIASDLEKLEKTGVALDVDTVRKYVAKRATCCHPSKPNRSAEAEFGWP